LLLTTRNQETIYRLDARLHTLDVFTSKQALILLAQWANTEVQNLPAEAKQVADECGNLPLALAMAGAMAKQKGWRHALERLRRADLERIEKAFPYTYSNLLRALQASLDDLDQSESLVNLQARKRYLQLAIFPEDTPIPTQALEKLWRTGPDPLDDLDFQDLLDGLKSRALLQRETESRVRLHDLQRDFIVNTARREKPLAERQAEFLDKCRSKTKNGLWHTLSDDGYIYQHLTWHMAEAGRGEELSKLLLDFDWLQSKLSKTDIYTLLHDYDIALGSPMDLSPASRYALSMVQDSLRLSIHVLARDKSQLAGQLLGRLLSFQEAEILAFLEQIKQHKSDQPWLRPLTAFLSTPGGAEMFTLKGHEDTVTAVALTPNGRLAVSGSWDSTLKVWDLTRPDAEPRTHLGHTRQVSAVAITSDGRLAVSASKDLTLKIWDLTRPDVEPRTLRRHVIDSAEVLALAPDGRLAVSGSWNGTLQVWDLIRPEPKTLPIEGPDDAVSAVAITPDGRLVVSGSYHTTLKVWDLTRPAAEPRTLLGHAGVITAVAVTPDGRLAVSGSKDLTLKVWDLTRPSAEPLTLMSHGETLRAIAVTLDGRLAVSGSWDKTLKVWDLTRPDAEPHTLKGHDDWVTAMAITPDGRLAVSGSGDGTLKVWDLGSSQILSTFTGDAVISSVSISGDGRMIFAGSETGDVYILQIEGFS
jgi:WD40 repeat protein